MLSFRGFGEFNTGGQECPRNRQTGKSALHKNEPGRRWAQDWAFIAWGKIFFGWIRSD